MPIGDYDYDPEGNEPSCIDWEHHDENNRRGAAGLPSIEEEAEQYEDERRELIERMEIIKKGPMNGRDKVLIDAIYHLLQGRI